MMHSFLSRQFLAFLITGGAAAVVNFGSRIFYNQSLSFSNSVILAYVTGMITAFILARIFVFKESTQPAHKSALFFALVNVVAALQTWLISMGLAYYVLPEMVNSHYSKEIAHAAGVIFPVFTSYLGHKHFSFR